MASVKMLQVYESVKAGKRVVSVPSADLPALSVWLWRNGYSQKTNRNGDVCNVMIEKRESGK